MICSNPTDELVALDVASNDDEPVLVAARDVAVFDKLLLLSELSPAGEKI